MDFNFITSTSGDVNEALSLIRKTFHEHFDGTTVRMQSIQVLQIFLPVSKTIQGTGAQMGFVAVGYLTDETEVISKAEKAKRIIENGN